MISGHVINRESISIRRMEAGPVTDVYIGGYRMRARGVIQRSQLTESRLAYP